MYIYIYIYICVCIINIYAYICIYIVYVCIYMYVCIYIYIYRVFKKSKKHFFKTFQRMSSSVNSLYYTFKNFLLYFTVILTIKLSLQ